MSQTKEKFKKYVMDILKEMNININDSFHKDDSFADYGISSAQVIILIEKLKENTGKNVDIESLWKYSTINEFIEALSEEVEPDETVLSSRSNLELEDSIGEEEQEEYAIIGMGCRFPGANSVEEFWNNLSNMENSITTRKYGNRQIYGGFIDDVDSFDNRFFRISPIEAEKMDPQQRHLLEVTWEAFEDAQIKPENYSGKEVGVFVGISSNDYGNELFAKADSSDIYSVTGNSHAIAANRLSYFYNFVGPSLSIDTACSSSLVAVHYACMSLRNSDCELAIVAGANTILNDTITNIFETSKMLSPDHQCKTFDDNANGYVRGEGIGVVILKKKTQAIADGNYIYSTILGSAINQDGKSNGLTAPNLESQVKVINKALRNANVTVDDISYVEAHGTGTNLGDPIEVAGLGEAICSNKKDVLRIGSVKTNIGHLEAAAGIASLIKVSLCLNNKKLVPSLNYSQLNKKISLDQGKIVVQTSLESWKSKGRRKAGISSFGFGGTNAHIILAELENSISSSEEKGFGLNRIGLVLPISGKCSESLVKNEKKAIEFVKAHNSNIANIASSYAKGKCHFDYRAAYMLDSINGDIKKILTRKDKTVSKVAFVFSGQGPSKINWSNEINSNKYFSDKLSEIDELFLELSGWSIKDVITNNSDKNFENTDVAQPVIFAIQVSLTYMLKQYGITPDGVVGHSLGEVAAATISGKLSLKDAVNVIYVRSSLMQCLKGDGGMLSIELPQEEVKKLIEEYGEDIRIAVINSKKSSVISGSKDILEKIKQSLDDKGIRNTMLGVLYPFHGTATEMLQEDIENLLKKTCVRTGGICVYSTVTGNKANARTFGAKYWSNQVYKPVLFAEAVENMVEDGFDYFVEINMQSLLCSHISRDHNDVEVISVLNKGMSQLDSIATLIGKSYIYKLPINWENYYCGNIKKISTPKYSWNNKSFWFSVVNDKSNSRELFFNETANRTESEEELVSVKFSWIRKMIADILHLDVSELQDDDKLVELGIDSIMAYSIKDKIELKYNCNIPFTFLIDDVTLNDVELFVETNAFNKRDEIEEIEVKSDISDMQSLLWTIYKTDPNNCAYNQIFVADILGDLDVQILKKSVQQLILDHSELRACFEEKDGRICKKILTDADITYFYYDEEIVYSDESIDDKIEEIHNTPFILENGNLFRVYLLREENHYVITVCVHHIVIDLASIEVILMQLIENYQNQYRNGKINNFVEKSYDKFVYEHKKYMDSEEGKNDKVYWNEKLKGNLPIVDLAINERPKHISYTGNICRTKIDENISTAIKKLARKVNITPSAFLMAIYYILLYKYTGERDLIIGMSASLRNEFKCQSTVGDFINLLPIRVEVESKKTFLDFALSVKSEILSAINHQKYPFKKILEDISLSGSNGFSPIVQVAFSQEVLEVDNQKNLAGFITGHKTEFNFAGISFIQRSSNINYSPYDLLLMADTSGNQINLSWQYKVDIMDEVFVLNMVSHYNNILKAIVENPKLEIKDIHILNDYEYEKIFNIFNDNQNIYDDRLFVNVFEEIVEKYPENIAISKDGRSYTYTEFNRNINKIGRYLVHLRLKHGDCVAICLNKSIEMIELMLAIIKIGCVYVPIDPSYPLNRISFILDSIKAKIVFTENSLKGVLDRLDGVKELSVADVISNMGNYLETNINHPIDKSDLAYIIFTSGTTGTPKGVMIEHVGICNMVRGLNKGWGIRDDSKVLQFASLSFDASIAEIFITLLSGAELVLKDRQDILPGGNLENVLLEEKITDVILTPSVLMLTDPSGIKDLRSVLSAGESCNSSIVKKWAHGRKFVNAYGPTESTVCATYKLCTEDDWDNITIGKPIEGTKIYILDDDLNPVPIGMKGELCITSIGLARGYINDPKLTKDKFIENTIDKNGFNVIYRTSDIVRYSQEGEIQFCGRKDSQVKIRGLRIELDEIENVLNKCSGVKEGTVIVKEISGDKKLVAFICPLDETVSENEIKKVMKESLPQYMIPSHFELVDSLPHNISGKIDKKIVSTYDILVKTIEVDDSEYSDVQKTIRKIWCEILGYNDITLEDDFYELGGHSLLASQLKVKIEKIYDITIEISDLLEYSKLVDFCDLIEMKKKHYKRGYASIEAKYETNYIPVTYSQNRLIFLYQLNTFSTEYNISGDLDLAGDINEKVFKEAYKNIVWENHSLRTVFFKENDKYYQRVVDNLEDYELDIKYENDKTKINTYIDEIKYCNFNLFTGPLIRARLIKTGDKQYIFVFSIHHIISDGWSISLLVDMWSDEYNNLLEGKETLTRTGVQFSDYAIWSAENIQGKKLDKIEEYWRARLYNHKDEVINIITDYERPSKMTSNGKIFFMQVEKELSSRIHEVCGELHVTLFMVLLSSFNILLNKLTGKKGFNIGIPVAGRNIEQTQNMMGLFVNTIVNHTDIDVDYSYVDFLMNVRKDILNDIDNQDMPFERVVEIINPNRTMSYSPIFQILFNMLNIKKPKFNLKNIESTERVQLDHEAKYDWTIYISDGDNIRIEFLYNVEIYKEEHIKLITHQYCDILEQITSDPSIKIRDISLSKENIVDSDINKTNYILTDMIRSSFSQYSNNIAIRTKTSTILYSELENEVLKYASFISGFINKEVIYLYSDRNEKLIYAILGCIFARKTFSIIDSRYPIHRVQSMLEVIPNSLIWELGEKKILENNLSVKYRERLIIFSGENQSFTLNNNLDEAFYVVFTSGTTGVPKAVKSKISTLAHFVDWYKNEFNVQENDIFSVLSGLSHDPIMRDILVPICSGASMCIPTDDVLVVPHKINEWVNDNLVTIIHQTPSLIKMFSKENIESVRMIGFGGEKLTYKVVNHVKKLMPNAKIINFYGTSETPQVMTFMDVSFMEEDVIPIGRGIDGVEALIVDDNHKVLGDMCIGQIAIRTDYLAEGYLSGIGTSGDMSFAEYNGKRIYYTGDIGYKDLNGNIVVLSRKDEQIKIRGFRIEPSEIENSILECHEIVDVKVLLEDDKLIAFVVNGYGKSINKNIIKQKLLNELPLYMVPDDFIEVVSIPLTVNGKADLSKLRELVHKKDIESSSVTLNGNTTKIVENVWKRLLKNDEISLNDNFFDVGGYSFLLLELYENLSELIEKKFEVIDLFRYPTIQAFADYIDNKEFDKVISGSKQADTTQKKKALKNKRRKRDNSIV